MILAICMMRLRPHSYPGWQRPVLGLIFVFAVFNAGLFVLTQIEVHAPKIMGLPFHHCLYDLWQYVPDTILMYLLFALGTFATGWAFVLDLVGRTDETTDILYKNLRMLYIFSIFCLAASMVMNTVHLLAV